MCSMNLAKAETGREYIVRDIRTEDEEMESFLFTLGCFAGEPITVVSRRHNSCVVAIKDARYCVDMRLAQAIIL